MHVLVIGGGIVGLAVSRELRASGHAVTVCEKEPDWGRHQTGRNSGVIHSGLYYKPGSLKARMCVAGARSMMNYAQAHGVPVRRTGKLVVATDDSELPALSELARRGRANAVPARRCDAAEAARHEPGVSCVAALWIPSTGVIDYGVVAHAMADELSARGACLRTEAQVTAIRSHRDRVTAETTAGTVRADALVNCAGLHSDRVARLAGLAPAARIVPFRGEYHELRDGAADRVRGLIYPVPDPALPFLGVHLTRGIDDVVHAGPNAVLALRREGYRRRDFDRRDLADVVSFPGFWRVVGRHAITGMGELWRSASPAAFAGRVSALVPGIHGDDLVPGTPGVRAQAVTRDGSLVDDFLIQTAPRQVHVLNAPSPAATASLEIARHVAAEVATSAG